MTKSEIDIARRDIEATADLLERTVKLSGLISTLFAQCGFPLVVVGGSAVEFYTEGGYMSGDTSRRRFAVGRGLRPRRKEAFMREPIVIGWDEWLTSRAAKRENLRRLGLDAPSRRTTDHGTSGRRLRKAFGGERAPRFDAPGLTTDFAE